MLGGGWGLLLLTLRVWVLGLPWVQEPGPTKEACGRAWGFVEVKEFALRLGLRLRLEVDMGFEG